MYWSHLNTILALILTVFVGKWLVQSGGTAIGWYLRRNTLTRRKAILAQVKLEEEAYRTREHHSPNLDDADWEEVKSYVIGSAVNGGPAADEWEGVVGFFHPFW